MTDNVKLPAEIDCQGCDGTAVADINCRAEGTQMFLCAECLTSWRERVRVTPLAANLCPRCVDTRLPILAEAAEAGRITPVLPRTVPDAGADPTTPGATRRPGERLGKEVECGACPHGIAIAAIDCHTEGTQLWLCAECLASWRASVHGDERRAVYCPRCVHARLGLAEQRAQRPRIIRSRNDVAQQILDAVDDALRAEGILVNVRGRVVNRLAYGHPDGPGDDQAVAS